MSIIIPISIFGFIVFGAVGIYWTMFRPPSAASKRLDQLRGNEAAIDKDVTEHFAEKLAERVAEPVNRLLPPSPATAKKLQKKLMYAGYRSPNAPLIYRAIQILSLVGIPAITAGVLITMGRQLSAYIIFAVLAGYIIPRYVLDY